MPDCFSLGPPAAKCQMLYPAALIHTFDAISPPHYSHYTLLVGEGVDYGMRVSDFRIQFPCHVSL